jgi:hypothetical protein
MTMFTREGLKSTRKKLSWGMAMHEAMHEAYYRLQARKSAAGMNPLACGFDASGSMTREEYNIAVDVAINACIPESLRPQEVELPFPLLLRF